MEDRGLNLDQSFEKLIRYIESQLEAEKKNITDIVDYLVLAGIDRDLAADLVDDIAANFKKKEFKRAYSYLIPGALLAIAGIILIIVFFYTRWIVAIAVAMTFIGSFLFWDGVKKLKKIINNGRY